MRRRTFLERAIAGAVIGSLAAPRIAQAQSARTLKYVPYQDLTLLDPIQSPAVPTLQHSCLAFDTLYGMAECIGSGPYRYVAGERVPGSLNVYERFAGYVPRASGVPSLLAGPKVASFDRVEWHTLPDPGTAAAALQSGEIDWWDQPSN